MENAVAPAAPPAPLAAGAAAPTNFVLTRRRSHLDSASYRTLSRLFSHCLHLHPSRLSALARPEVVPAADNPIIDSGEPLQGNSAPLKDSDFDRRKDAEGDLDVGSTPRLETPTTAGVEAAAANPTDPTVALQGSPELVMDRLGDIGIFVEDLGIGAGLLGENEALKSMKASLEGEIEESVEVPVGNDDGHLLLDAIMTNFSGLIDDASGDTMLMQNSSCGVSSGKLQNDGNVAEDVVELGGGIEKGSPVGNLDHGLVDAGSVFEEGEIEGDMQALDADESGNSVSEDEDADDEKLEEDGSRGKKENESCDRDLQCLHLHLTPKIKGHGDVVLNKEGNIKNDAQMHGPRAQTVSYDDVVDWNEIPLPDDEPVVPGKKRKRQLTEDRKAKKTKNKRVKRAQQRIADGVKRLKLQPIIKPKVVKDCHFYLHGKCQQGSTCKFSHDKTPLTKSKPCTHFARGSCLKGDDCPYDHELSKYPCHNFLEKGMCVRGDKCKFSHVVPTADGPSTPDLKKYDASLVSEKGNLKEQTSSQKASTVCNGEPVASASTKTYSILQNLAGISLNPQKASARIPKGVQFLPFSQDSSDSSILHQDALSTMKHSCINGGQHRNFGGLQAAEGTKIAKQNGQKSAPLPDEKNYPKKATLYPCSESQKTSLPISSTAVPRSVTTLHEVSEASKILQEFLFGAGS